jgi:hypothetical protein
VKKRIETCLALALLAIVSLRPGSAAAEKTGDELVEQLVLLYVQSADSGSFDGQRLTLDGVGTTLFFSDRPARVSGHIDTAKFLGAWGADAGDDGFAADPPNATLSILGGETPVNTVVELREPKRDGKKISYAVKVLEGKIPDAFGEASLFIDHHSGNAGDYIATGLGGAILGGALVAATDKPKEKEYAPPPSYSGDGYYYRAAPPPPMACAPCAPCAACPR